VTAIIDSFSSMAKLLQGSLEHSKFRIQGTV
jgi:hypothetical protein